MTNAIEQSKREMYSKLAAHTKHVEFTSWSHSLGAFGSAMESYLELLRQDHEALHETARKLFEDIQKLEKANVELGKGLESANRVVANCASQSLKEIRDLEGRTETQAQSIKTLQHNCMALTTERDTLRNKVQAMEMASATSAGVILGLRTDLNRVRQSLLMAGFPDAATSVSNSDENVAYAKLDGKTAAILGAVVDARQIVSDWAIYGYRARKQMKKLAYALNNNPELSSAMSQFEKPDSGYAVWFMNNDKCQHSFFAIGDEPAKCTYCCEVEK